jgi:hypothetical protein
MLYIERRSQDVIQLSLYYLECVLTPQDSPEDPLRGAIERAQAKASELEAADEPEESP